MQKVKGKALRPRTVLEVLDRTFNIYRDSFTRFVALVAVITVPITLISLIGSYALTRQFSDIGLSSGNYGSSSAQVAAFNQRFGGIFSSSLLLLGVLLIFQFIQGVVINSTLTYLASERHLGRSASIGEALAAVRGRFASVGLGLLIFYVIAIALFVGLAFVFYCLGLALPVLVWLAITLYAFIVPVLVLERTTVTEGMNRAWALAKARFWPVFGFSVAVFFITAVIYLALNLTVTVLLRGTITSASFGAAQILQTLLQAIITVFLAPILPIGYTVLYYDTRVRLEGLDIALESVQTPDPRVSELVSPPPVGPTISRNDLMNIGILLAITVVFALLVFGVAPLLLRNLL